MPTVIMAARVGKQLCLNTFSPQRIKARRPKIYRDPVAGHRPVGTTLSPRRESPETESIDFLNKSRGYP